MNIHKDDLVVIIAGRDGAIGDERARHKERRSSRVVRRVRQVIPDKNRVIVEGANIHRKHTKGRSGARQAGIIEIEAPLDASKVMVFCTNCQKGVRVGNQYNPDGTKSRICRSCGNNLDNETDRRWQERRDEVDQTG